MLLNGKARKCGICTSRPLSYLLGAISAPISSTVAFDIAPTIVGVYVSGSAWNPAYYSTLAAAGVGNSWGYAMPSGAGQLSDANIPGWSNMNTITIVFSEPVSGVTASSLTLGDSGNNGGPASGLTVASETNTSSTVAKFTLSSTFTSNKYYMDLAASGITDAAGTALDGLWTAKTSTFAAGSGNGTPGSNFVYEFYMLPGNVNRDGKVSSADLSKLRTIELGPDIQGSDNNWQYDLNGDNKISSADVAAQRSQALASIDNFPEPVPPAAGLATAAVSVVGLTTTSDGSQLQVGYNVTSDAFQTGAASSFTINIDAEPAGTLLQQEEFSTSTSPADDFTMGYHVVQFPPAFAGLSGDTYLVAQVGPNPANMVVCQNGALLTTTGQLEIFGGSGPDSVSILQSTQTPPAIQVALNSQNFSFLASSVSSIYVQTYAGNDTVWAGYGVSQQMTVYGAGADTIVGDGYGGNSLNGGPGSSISNSPPASDAPFIDDVNVSPNVNQNNQTPGDGCCTGGASPGSDLTGGLVVEGPASLPFVLHYDSMDPNKVVVAFDYTFDPFQALPASISATVTLAGTDGNYSIYPNNPTAVNYQTAGLAPGTTVELMQELDLTNSNLPAGQYKATMVVKNSSGDVLATLQGMVDYLGNGQPAANFDQGFDICQCCKPAWLQVNGGGSGGDDHDDVTLGDPAVYVAVPVPGEAGQFVTPAGSEGTLAATYNSNTQDYTGFTLTFPDGETEEFDLPSPLGANRFEMTSRTDPQGNQTDYIYYPNGQLEYIEDALDPASSAIEFQDYNGTNGPPAGFVNTVTDEATGDTFGFTYAQNYAGDWQLSTITDNSAAGGAGATWTYAYYGDTGNASAGLLESVTTPTGGVTTYYYDSTTGCFTGETQSGGGTTSTMSLTSIEQELLDAGQSGTLVPVSQVHSTRTDFSGDVSYYTTDTYGNVSSETNPLGQATTYVRDDNGNVLTETAPGPDGQPAVTTYTYDQYGNVTSETYPDGSSETWGYEYNTNPSYAWQFALVSQTDQLGNVTTYTIDPNTGLTTSTTTAAGTAVDIYSDGANNGGTYAVTVPNYTTPGGQMSSSTGLISYTALGYGANSNYDNLPVGTLLEEIDPLDNVTCYQYGTDNTQGSFDQQTAVTTAYGTSAASTVTYTYDQHGNQISMTDPLGNTTDYTYNSEGELTSTIGPYPNPGGAQEQTIANLTGSGWTNGGSGSNQYEYSNSPQAQATWTFKKLVVGQRYEIEATWPASTANTADAAYTIVDGTAPLVTVSGFSQQVAPLADYTSPGTNWQQVFVFTAQDASVTVTLEEVNMDGCHRLVAQAVQIQQARPVTTYQYDVYGNQVATIDPMGDETDTTYDAFGNQETSQTGPYATGAAAGLSGAQYFYNAAQQETGMLSPDGQLTTYSYTNGGVQEEESGQVIEAGQAGFSDTGPTGSWTSYPAALGGGNYALQAQASGSTSSYNATATWTFTGLVVGQWYDVLHDLGPRFLQPRRVSNL